MFTPTSGGCQSEMRAAAKSTLERSSGHKSAPISCAPPSSPDESGGQSAPRVPKDKNGHLLGEQKAELWLKPLCLQQQLFNPFVWCMKLVPRTQGLLITVGPFPSLQINWQKPLTTSFWMLLSFRGGKWPLLETGTVFFLFFNLACELYGSPPTPDPHPAN